MVMDVVEVYTQSWILDRVRCKFFPTWEVINCRAQKSHQHEVLTMFSLCGWRQNMQEKHKDKCEFGSYYTDIQM